MKNPVRLQLDWEPARVYVAGTAEPDDGAEHFSDEKVLTIKFDYPLPQPVSIKFESEAGFTKSELLRCIRDGYRKFYAQESVIWGHDIGDLVIEGVGVKDGVVELFVAS